jgi:hypothetical protein
MQTELNAASQKAQDDSLTTKERQAAQRRVQELQDSIRKERQGLEYEPPARTATQGRGGVRQAAPSMPKLSEQQIRDAAKAKNLDPDKAVERARARGQL